MSNYYRFNKEFLKFSSKVLSFANVKLMTFMRANNLNVLGLQGFYYLFKVRETPDGQTTVSELSDRVVHSPNELLEQLKSGNDHRTVGATNMNAVSSRSHAVFTIQIEQQSIR